MSTAAANPTTWTDVLMTDHEMTERVFAAFERVLAGPLPAVGGHRLGRDGVLHRLRRGVPQPQGRRPSLPDDGSGRHAAQGGPLAVMLGEHEQSERCSPS
jgi:hypothetical protein